MREISLAGYQELLSAFKEAGYTFCGFGEIDKRLTERIPIIVLRHDIEVSLRPALDLARVEQAYGVRATYFVLLRSPYYNTLSRPNGEILTQIHQLGHSIALHVDLSPYQGDYAKALREVGVLASFYPYIDTEIVSIHCPGDLKYLPISSFSCINSVYGPILRGEMAYISDSTGRWLYGHPLDSRAFLDRKSIQLLTHPLWWIQEGETTIKKLERWLQNDTVNSFADAREFLPKLFRSDEP
jgi:hypothetical protein